VPAETSPAVSAGESYSRWRAGFVAGGDSPAHEDFRDRVTLDGFSIHWGNRITPVSGEPLRAIGAVGRVTREVRARVTVGGQRLIL